MKNGTVLLSTLFVFFLFPWGNAAISNPALRVRNGSFVAEGGKTLKMRGVMYYQPSAYHQYFWDELQEALIDSDFQNIAEEGFNIVHIEVSWGSFMRKANLRGTEGYQWDEASEKKLKFILRKAKEHGLYVSLYTSYSRAPADIGAKYYSDPDAIDDTTGHQHSSFYGYLVPCLFSDGAEGGDLWNKYLVFHKKIATIAKTFGNVIYDPVDWQSLNLSYWEFGTPCELDAWVEYLKGINPDLKYWNDRWSEENKDWSDILFPVDESVKETVALLPNSAYWNIPVLGYDQPKWADARGFFDEMLDKMTEEVVAAIRSVDRKAIIGQRIDLWRYGDFRKGTWNNPGIDFDFYSGYPEGEDEAWSYPEPLKSRLSFFSQFATKPIYLWECGTVPEDPDENVLVKVVTAIVGEFSEKTSIVGYSFWTWRDDYMRGYQDIGLMTADGEAKPALKETEKLFQHFGFIAGEQTQTLYLFEGSLVPRVPVLGPIRMSTQHYLLSEPAMEKEKKGAVPLA